MATLDVTATETIAAVVLGLAVLLLILPLLQVGAVVMVVAANTPNRPQSTMSAMAHQQWISEPFRHRRVDQQQQDANSCSMLCRGVDRPSGNKIRKKTFKTETGAR